MGGQKGLTGPSQALDRGWVARSRIETLPNGAKLVVCSPPWQGTWRACLILIRKKSLRELWSTVWGHVGDTCWWSCALKSKDSSLEINLPLVETLRSQVALLEQSTPPEAPLAASGKQKKGVKKMNRISSEAVGQHHINIHIRVSEGVQRDKASEINVRRNNVVNVEILLSKSIDWPQSLPKSQQATW